MKKFIYSSRYLTSLIISILFFNISFPISEFIVNDNSKTALNCLFISLVLSIGIFIFINHILMWIFKQFKKLLMKVIYNF